MIVTYTSDLDVAWLFIIKNWIFETICPAHFDYWLKGDLDLRGYNIK